MATTPPGNEASDRGSIHAGLRLLLRRVRKDWIHPHLVTDWLASPSHNQLRDSLQRKLWKNVEAAGVSQTTAGLVSVIRSTWKETFDELYSPRSYVEDPDRLLKQNFLEPGEDEYVTVPGSIFEPLSKTIGDMLTESRRIPKRKQDIRESRQLLSWIAGTMAWFGGFSQTAIASHLQVSPETVKRLLNDTAASVDQLWEARYGI
jgi:hypothetical protein